MNFVKLTFLSLGALLAAGASIAAPLRTLPDLQSIRIYEITFSTVATTYAPGASALMARLPDPLGAANRDFSFVANEYYDAFYSDADGTANADGAYLTVEGVWRQSGGAGGMNINEVELVFGGASPRTQFGSFVSSFEYGTGNVTVGSEALAADGNLATFPRMGNTSVADLTDRFRVTIGFAGISVPEPAPSALAAVGLGGLLALGRRRRS